MSILQDIHTTIDRDDSTAVRSHQSYDPQVHAICHHSGQYLTWNEANHPIWKRLLTRLLREQHDFPGLRHLDRAFGSAAHANEHQHIAWSHIAIQSIALLVIAPLAILLILGLLGLQDYVPLPYWYIYLAGLALFSLGSAVMILVALTRYSQREALFHKNSTGKPPAIADYPVHGTYHIEADEHITIHLDNVNRARPEVISQRAELSVTLVPDQGQWEDYATYRQQYEGLAVGDYIHAGVVALENLRHVQFLDDTPEFDHRIALRLSTRQLGLEEFGKLPSSLTVKTAYEIAPTALYSPHNGLVRFPLEIEPRLSPNDSRTLELHFFWRGQDPTAVCRLDECILTIPDVLGKVTRVKYGRPDHERQQVVWRNRSFRQQSLVLSMTFGNPVLACHKLIYGRYTFSYEGLLSAMEIHPERIWTALGTPAPKDACHIIYQTTVNGNLTLGLQRLSQEHEHVQAMPPLICDVPPNENLVRVVTNVLLEEGFDLQRVTRTAPRLDPTGRLDKQLFYWDIIGRRYIEELLDALDVHVVITGSDRIIHTSSNDGTFQPRTHIDLRVRCLHDPRNASTPEMVDTLIGRSDESSLAAKIQKAVAQHVQPY